MSRWVVSISGPRWVVGSGASVSMVFRPLRVDQVVVGSTTAPGPPRNQDAIGQAAQAFSALSWGPEGGPAEPSSAPATVASTVLGDVLQLVEPTVILKEVALQDNVCPLQAA